MDVSRYRFSCQKALHQGLQLARSFGHPHLEVEHVALALLREEDSASLGLSLVERNALQGKVERYLRQLPTHFGAFKTDFGLRLDAALDAAENEQGGAPISPTLLWTCLQVQCELLQGEGGSSSASPPSPDTKQTPKKSKAPETPAGFSLPDSLEKVLKAYTVDLTALAERKELDPVIGRDSETRRVIEILGRKKKNNPVLIGEAGVGKTAVVEALAQRIAQGLIPETMRGKRVLSLDLGGLIAGTKFRGEFEERMGLLIQAIQACGGNVVLFIDELHTLVGSGRAEGSADAANLLKPALARGELHCIGATTFDEYQKYIEKDPALERRFQPVVVAEPTREASISILRGLKSHYEIFHGVQIQDEALVQAVDLSIRYVPTRRLPDKAIDLLDEACSRVRIQIDSVPLVMDQLQTQAAQLEIERKTLVGDPTAATALTKLDVRLHTVQHKLYDIEKIWRNHQGLLEQLRKEEKTQQEQTNLFEQSKVQGNFDLAAKLQHEEIPRVEIALKETRTQLEHLQKTHAWLRQVVGSLEIANVVSAGASIPVQRMIRGEGKSPLDIETRLAGRVCGQREAVQRVSKAIQRVKVGIQDPNRPLGVFLFIGPTGVGKTQMAKALAEELFEEDNRLLRFDMSEFMEPHTVARLVGAPPGYQGADEGGRLTEAVRRTPYTVLLFDEIEKAHPKVLDLLLQVFDEGRLSDAKGLAVDFRHTLIILTSNLLGNLHGRQHATLATEDALRTELVKVLRPEFVGRLDEVVAFHKLGRLHLRQLVEKYLGELNVRLAERQFRILLGPKLVEKLVQESVRSEFGGRALRRVFQRWVVDGVSERVLLFEQGCSGVWCMELGENGALTWTLDYTPHRYLPAAA